MKIKNIDNLSVSQIKELVNSGGKFVIFPYTISIIFMTFKRNSNIYFINPDESTFKYSYGYFLVNLFLGWWGIPWGPIYTIGAIYNHAKGGKNVTPEIMSHLIQNDPDANTSTYAINNLINNSTNTDNQTYNIPRNN